ncbi:hypothetical protein E4U27_003896 [Claviceps purpurea]|nr:hypothetical protein E4U27_003896 [Claviceps purpurea]
MARDERRTMQAVDVAVSRYRTTQSSGASEARPPFGRDAVSRTQIAPIADWAKALTPPLK